ncbi:MAG: transposase [Hormoscilla sp. GM102CHS1]|nr:transposase [Hormoscilla sp. GM102CHS1]
MQCPKCESTNLRKNGRASDKQRYRCKYCGHNFVYPKSAELVRVLDEVQETAAETVSLPVLAQPDVPQDRERLSLLASVLLETLNSNEFRDAAAALEQPNLPQLPPPPAQPESGIAILLLDAENLNKFDVNLERFLSGIGNYPLQVKIAFANWRKMPADKDPELYEQGYQLIHVPLGKNSADAQMLAMGAGVSRHYPDAKEVFVCSSDWLLTHLCNELQTQGLTVYRVCQQNKNLTVENRLTGEKNHYSLSMKSEIPDFAGLVQQVEHLLAAEHASINERIGQLSAVAHLFEERHRLHTSELANYSIAPEPQPLAEPTAEPTAGPTLIDSREDLEKAMIVTIEGMLRKQPPMKLTVVNISKELHKVYGESANAIIKRLKLAPYVSKFLQSCQSLRLRSLLGIKLEAEDVKKQVSEINSRADMEKVMIDIVQSLTIQSSGSYINISKVGTEFQKRYGHTVTKTMRRLNLGSKFNKFLQDCSSLKLKKNGKRYEVALMKR